MIFFKGNNGMKNINFKKLLPGIISILLIAGMAIHSFATDIDLAAFVEMDYYTAKYAELDYRINDIEASLNRLYKFTCANVRTFGGQTAQNPGSTLFVYYDSSSTQGWRPWPIADLAQQKYLRFNYLGTLRQPFAVPANTHTWTYKKPANLIKWHPDIEPAPNCSVEINIRRRWPSGTSWTTVNDLSEVILTMGPFKKFPRYTSTGALLSNGYICEFPDFPFLSSVTPNANEGNYKYAYGQETLPTSWTNEQTMRVTVGGSVTVTKSTTGTQYKTDDIKKKMDTATYTDPGVNYQKNTMYMSVVPNVNFSQYENLWLRVIYNYAGPSGVINYISYPDLNLTTWNNNK